ncbi:hypothetical protein [Streptomyces sp. NPDC058335]|uniref:hypothetical protein n=1 Tax=Streptomyces sp. NPDC058335 TaxID=3346451 RepID=UPI0036631119
MDRARCRMRDHYAFTGRADHMVDGMLTTAHAVRDTAAAFAGIGTDELTFSCWTSDPDQIDRIADAMNQRRARGPPGPTPGGPPMISGSATSSTPVCGPRPRLPDCRRRDRDDPASQPYVGGTRGRAPRTRRRSKGLAS